MRIQSVTEVNTNQQQNPYIPKKTDSATIGKNASFGSFKDCLKPYVQDSKVHTVTHKAELTAAGALMSCFIPQRATLRPKPEMKQKIRVYTSPPDL